MYDDEASLGSPEIRRSFSGGLKRKRIAFVPQAQDSARNQSHPSSSILPSDRYLSIVLKNGTSSQGTISRSSDASNAPSSGDRAEPESRVTHTLCKICNLPISVPNPSELHTRRPHEASIAHMVCLKHSHPPPDFDRTRPGLKYLSSYGWDPDSRLGLGASGEGIRAPIKVKIKNDTLGLGIELQDGVKAQIKKKESLNAKQARRKDSENKKKGEKLQELFYGNDDLQKYLGYV